MLARLATHTDTPRRSFQALCRCWCALALFACGPWVAAASGPAVQAGMASTSASTRRTVSSRRHAVHKQAAVPAPPEAASAPPVPAAPPMPNWPANDKPVDATVVWDSHGLRIVAANSSLRQILDQVATETGAKLEGMNGDQRVFGSFGPGPARDVITQLLDGSGYNVLILGDQDGAPRQIMLSSRPNGPAPVYRNNPADEEVEIEPPPPEPQPMPMPMQNPEPPNRGVIQPQMQMGFPPRPIPGPPQGQEPNQQQ